MKLTEHQKKLWNSMINLIDAYIAGKINFGYLTPSLEGILDASEIKDKDLIERWYDFWIPMDLLNADKEILASNEYKTGLVKTMRDFLEEVIKEQA